MSNQIHSKADQLKTSNRQEELVLSTPNSEVEITKSFGRSLFVQRTTSLRPKRALKGVKSLRPIARVKFNKTH